MKTTDGSSLCGDHSIAAPQGKTAKSHNNGCISKKIFSVDLAGDLKSVSDAYELVRTLLNTLVRADVPLASVPTRTIQCARTVETSHNPNTIQIQISIFERSMS